MSHRACNIFFETSLSLWTDIIWQKKNKKFNSYLDQNPSRKNNLHTNEKGSQMIAITQIHTYMYLQELAIFINTYACCDIYTQTVEFAFTTPRCSRTSGH